MSENAEQLTLDGRSVPHREVVGGPSTSRMVRRPRLVEGDGGFDSSGFAAAVLMACNRAGVDPGEAFYVSRVPPVSSLGGDGAVRSTDPVTSRAAAKDVPPRRGSQRAAVLLALRDTPASADGLEWRTGIEFRSLTPRVGELKRWGYVEETGETQPGKRGSDQQVVRLTDKGRAMVEQLGREEAGS